MARFLQQFHVVSGGLRLRELLQGQHVDHNGAVDIKWSCSSLFGMVKERGFGFSDPQAEENSWLHTKTIEKG